MLSVDLITWFCFHDKRLHLGGYSHLFVGVAANLVAFVIVFIGHEEAQRIFGGASFDMRRALLVQFGSIL